MPYFSIEAQRVEHVAPDLAHLLALLVADQPVQVDGAEGNIARILHAHHNHPGHPEEEDVVAGLHDRGRVEIAQVFGIIGPAQGGVRPQPGAEPGIQHIRVLLDIRRAAVWAGLSASPRLPSAHRSPGSTRPGCGAPTRAGG